jgi:hypothetical protein
MLLHAAAMRGEEYEHRPLCPPCQLTHLDPLTARSNELCAWHSPYGRTRRARSAGNKPEDGKGQTAGPSAHPHTPAYVASGIDDLLPRRPEVPSPWEKATSRDSGSGLRRGHGHLPKAERPTLAESNLRVQYAPDGRGPDGSLAS